ncbi:uncharacterized protein LOC122243953 isoform X2 [Penaeus japonicus]|uniref:uncharacterized protein LOC122243953 isoform X2 n=1 Tax=Penaeus japonicus TaxID=27405 RepID=UPI001C70E63F|nr:uncharacterized protein LOC122243953 isoform X2 [Penaeus japonicus]
MWDVMGVSRSGRVRKKPAMLKDFESLYDVRARRMPGRPPKFPEKERKLIHPMNTDNFSNSSMDYDICNVICEPSRVGNWKDNDRGDEETIDSQQMADTDKTDPLLLDTSTKSSNSNLGSDVLDESDDIIIDDYFEVKEEPLDFDYLRDYKIGEDVDDDMLEDDPLRIDGEIKFIQVDTSDYNQIQSLNKSENTEMKHTSEQRAPAIHPVSINFEDTRIQSLNKSKNIEMKDTSVQTAPAIHPVSINFEDTRIQSLKRSTNGEMKDTSKQGDRAHINLEDTRIQSLSKSAHTKMKDTSEQRNPAIHLANENLEDMRIQSSSKSANIEMKDTSEQRDPAINQTKINFEDTKNQSINKSANREMKDTSEPAKDPAIHQASKNLEDTKQTRWTSYRLWAKIARSDILQTSPNMDFSDVNRKLGELWSLVPSAKKYNWKRRAKRLNEKEKVLVSLRQAPVTASVSDEKGSQLQHGSDSAPREHAESLKKMNSISTTDRRAMPSFDFAEQGFSNIIILNEKKKIILRTNAGTMEKAMAWKDVYCQRYDYHFTCKKSHKAVITRFHGVFQCLYGDRQYQESNKIYTKCPVMMDMKIKIPKKDTIEITHPCLITIKGSHNHHTVLEELTVIKEVKKEFFKYFDVGMTAAQVSRFHEDKTNLSVSDMGYGSLNPTISAISFVYNLWLQERQSNAVDLNMSSAIKKYAMENPTSKIELEVSENGFTAVLVTEFMLRVHKELKEAGDMVFVDTTCHRNQVNTVVTSLLCAGPAGAAPLGVIFTSSQEEGSYVAGFCMLKKVLGKDAFCGRGHPQCFRTNTTESERKALKAVWPRSEIFLSNFHLLRQVWQCLCNGSDGFQKEHHPQLMNVAQQLVYADSPDKFEYLWELFSQSPEFRKYDQYSSYLAKLVERKEEWCIAYGKGKFLVDQHTNNIAESTMCIIRDIINNRG